MNAWIDFILYTIASNAVGLLWLVIGVFTTAAIYGLGLFFYRAIKELYSKKKTIKKEEKGDGRGNN